MYIFVWYLMSQWCFQTTTLIFVSIRQPSWFLIDNASIKSKNRWQNMRVLAHEVNYWPALLSIFFYIWIASDVQITLVFNSLRDFQLITQGSSQKAYNYCVSLVYSVLTFFTHRPLTDLLNFVSFRPM